MACAFRRSASLFQWRTIVGVVVTKTRTKIRRGNEICLFDVGREDFERRMKLTLGDLAQDFGGVFAEPR